MNPAPDRREGECSFCHRTLSLLDPKWVELETQRLCCGECDEWALGESPEEGGWRWHTGD